MRQFHSAVAIIPISTISLISWLSGIPAGCSVQSAEVDVGEDNGSIDPGEADISATHCSVAESLSPETTVELDVPLAGALLVGDFDGDGIDDVASGAGMVLVRKPDMGFAAPIDLQTSNDQMVRFVADINGDDRSDLIGRRYSDSALIVFLARPQGGFEPAEVVEIASSDAPDGIDLFAEDFDGDGRDEVAVYSNSGRKLTILRRNGKDDWSTLQTFASSNDRWVLTGGRVDEDEHVDLVAVDGGDTQVHFGHGDGTFAAPVSYFAGAVGVGVPFSSPVDAGLRGIVYTGDVGFLAQPSAGIVVLWADDAGFTGQGFETNWPTDAVAIGDLQGDGFGDVVAVTNDVWGHPMLAVLCGGPTDYADCGRLPLLERPRSIGMVDMDGDGRDDVVYVSSQARILHVLLANGSAE